MTENEAINGWTFEETIQCAENLMEEEKNIFKWDVLRHLRDFAENYKDEVQQYRASGTVEGYELAINASIDKHNLMIVYKDRLKEYEAIGTVEEFKALKEKNTPYKPQEYEDRYYACKCDNILLPKWRKYPTELMPKSEGLPHCMSCGQKLDWN